MNQEKTHLYRESYDETWCGIEEVASKGLLYTEKEENVTCLSCLYWRSGGLGVPDKINENKQLPTAETILKQEFYGDEWEELMSNLNSDITPSVVSAMEEHTRLRIADYKRRTEERMIELETELEKLREENERLNKVISDYSSQVGDLQDEQENLSDENYGIMVENQKLREALEDIASDRGDYLEIAKEALKG